MRLIVIYGPPAVGKLTVGKQLAKITGYRLFHNHLAIDLVHEIYDWDDPAFFSLVHTIRSDVIRSAAKSDTNIILTFFYTGAPAETAFFEHMEDIVNAVGGDTIFVHLTAPLGILLDRVTDHSRKQHGKLTDKEALESSLHIHKDTAYNTANHLDVDTSRMQPAEIAQVIKGILR